MFPQLYIGNKFLYFLMGSTLLIYLSGLTSQHGEVQLFLQGAADKCPKTQWKDASRSRNQLLLRRNQLLLLFIFAGLKLGSQQYLGFIPRVIFIPQH